MIKNTQTKFLPSVFYLWAISVKNGVSLLFLDRVNCGILSTVPSTSNTKTGTLYSDIITYKCLPGFIHVNGTLSRKCQADKVWDGKPPYCGKITVFFM